jgi:hypothetical protein
MATISLCGVRLTPGDSADVVNLASPLDGSLPVRFLGFFKGLASRVFQGFSRGSRVFRQTLSRGFKGC